MLKEEERIPLSFAMISVRANTKWVARSLMKDVVSVGSDVEFLHIYLD